MGRLVLRRKVGESLVVKTNQGSVFIDVSEIHQSYVNLGVRAPREMTVLRIEAYLNEQRQERTPALDYQI